MNSKLHVPKHSIPGGWTIGPNSRLLDVWTKNPLLMYSPDFIYDNHDITFFIHDNTSASADSTLHYDCRHDTTANIAHILQNQIGIALCALDTLGLEGSWRNLIFIVHRNTPLYAIQLYETLGFTTLCTDKAVGGRFIKSNPTEFLSRSIAGDYLHKHAVKLGVIPESPEPGDPIFIARKGRRSLNNLREIETLLRSHGYKTIYAEDMDIFEQIRTISCAKSIVGLHGAALGYLMFRDPSLRGELIELFSSVYSNNWARAIASRKNMDWVGCVGNFDFRRMQKLNSDCHPRKFESLCYKISPDALDLILRAVSEPGRINTNIPRLCSISIPNH
ncbi:MAG: glycosyltransferase 61 family protein [Phycisphaerales bacterium JB052]